jgi:superfamily I DNA/RNA helicase
VEWLAGLFDTAAEFVMFMTQLKDGVKLGRKKFQKEGSEDALVLSTIHQAKGLEWPVVFLTDVVQGRHPWTKAHSLAEELRLGYVAVTRAKYACYVSHSAPEDEGAESFVVRKLTSWARRVTATEDDEGNVLPTENSESEARRVTAT